MSLQRFVDQFVMVTGAGRGIGAAVCEAFAREGADVALVDIKPPEETAEKVRRWGRRALVVAADVADSMAMEGAVDRALREWGRLDVFVANAAYQHRGLFWEIPLEEYHRVVDVTMWGPLYGLRAAAKVMIPQRTGNIVVVSSGQAVVPCPLSMPYNMAKAAIDHMARTAAIELLPHKIRVNVIHPGWTDTPGERKFFTDDEMAEKAKNTPGGRLAKPEEIAYAVLFCADRASEFINGATLPIGGGINLPRPWNM